MRCQTFSFCYLFPVQQATSERDWTTCEARAPVNTPAQFCERSTAAKKRLKNLLYKKPIIWKSPLHLRERIFRGQCGATYIFFYLEWPEGIVSIPVGQPDPTRPISLTLTQIPLPQLTAWSQFMAGAWS